MAKFNDVLEAIKNNKKFQHENFYDGQWISWQNQDKHLLLSPKFLLSDRWQIEPADDVDNFVDSDDSVKKKQQAKK